MRRAEGGTRHLYHRSIVQPQEPAFWVFVAFVIYGAVRIVETLSGLAGLSTSGWALAWLMLGLYALPASVLIYGLDLYEHEPISLALGAVAWGAFAATALSIDAAGWDEVVVAVLGTDLASRWAPAIVAPIVEETMKGVGVVLLYLIARDELDDLMDGFVYGALCGLGFAIVEDVAYFSAAFGGGSADVLSGFAVRVIASGLYGHVLYTGLVGMGIGYVVTRRQLVPLRRRLGVATALALTGLGGHALWNAPLFSSLMPVEPIEGAEWVAFVAVVALKGLPLLVVVVLAIRLAHRREHRWLEAALTLETGGEGITMAELRTLADPRARREAVRAMRRRAGPAAARLLARLQREQVHLAMVASRVDLAGDDCLESQRERCRSLRAALAAIPGSASATRDDGAGVAGRAGIEEPDR